MQLTRGSGLAPRLVYQREVVNVKVRISKRVDGKSMVVVVPSRARGLPPLACTGVLERDLTARVRELVALVTADPAADEAKDSQVDG